MWNVKTELIPVKIGATGTITKSCRKHISNVPGKHDIKEIKKKGHMGHSTCILIFFPLDRHVEGLKTYY
jgi:hypothetical protein